MSVTYVERKLIEKLFLPQLNLTLLQDASYVSQHSVFNITITSTYYGQRFYFSGGKEDLTNILIHYLLVTVLVAVIQRSFKLRRPLTS